MPRHLVAVVVAAPVLLGSCASKQEVVGPVTDQRLNLKGPTLLAFLAPSGSAEQRRDVEKAVDKAADCLEESGLTVRAQIVEKDWVKVKDGDRELPLYPPFEGTTGVFLLLPGRPPRYVDTVAGTGTLLTSLSDAAARYFDAGRCARTGS